MGSSSSGSRKRQFESGDGSFTIQLSAAFTPPSLPAASSAAIPLLSLSPTIATTGGTLAGGRSFYYAVSAVDATGAEGGLSFIVQATLPPTTNTNQVTLTGFSFSAGAAGFRVYRGLNPSQLLLIESSSSVASSYTDSGAATELEGPPDPNYDHANFYWRLELQPEEVVTAATSTTIGNSTLGMLTNDFAGGLVRITRGKGATQERSVVSNTSDDTNGDARVDRDAGYDELLHGGGLDLELRRLGINESGEYRCSEPARRIGGDFGPFGECAKRRKLGGIESSDIVADRWGRGRRRG